MSVLVFALVAVTAVQARAGEMSSCVDGAVVETGSCGGDATSSPSFIQTALQSSRPREGYRARRARRTRPVETDQEEEKKDVGTIGSNFCRPDVGAHLRVRKNIFDMDRTTWDQFKAAFRSFYTKGLYTKFSVEHTMHYENAPEHGHFRDHNGAYGFLAFHRGQIQDLETELMQEADDCEMTFPFWDWSLDVASFEASEIWSEGYMGNSVGCVMTGLPAGWTYDAPDLNLDDPCVERHVRTSRGLVDSRRLALMIGGNPDFEVFVRNLEAIHNTFHGAVGGRPGNMASKVGRASPSDPMFYLHHAFIDSVYFRWQTIYNDNSAPLLRESLRPVVGIYDNDQDCVYLPVHRSLADDVEATCVSYQPAENAHPQDSLLLQTFASDNSCMALQKQILHGECSPEELRMLVCVTASQCLVSEDEEFEESRMFDKDATTEKVFENTLHKLTGELTCHGYSAEYNVAERHHCYKCDVPCGGDDKKK